MPEKIPETRTIKPNRAQRRHPEHMGDADQPVHQEIQEDILKARTQDVQSVRAKNSGHGKKTADKWNQ